VAGIKGNMFVNLGPALLRIRELRRKSQTRVARDAQIGKSQLSKYETGKELPRLDSLERILVALDLGYYEFFFVLQQMDRGADRPLMMDRSEDDIKAVFEQLMSDLLDLHRQTVLARSQGGARTAKEIPLEVR
jgi:transcriptional regulator with XRE-family HTH domain